MSDMSRDEQIILCQDILLGEPHIQRGGIWMDDVPVMGWTLRIGRHNIGGGKYAGVFPTPAAAAAHATETKQRARELLLRAERESRREGTFVHREIAVAPSAAFEHVASEHCPCRPDFIDAQSTSEHFGRSPTGWDN